MPVFERISRYPYPRATVFAWFTRPGALIRLTPPGMVTVIKPHSDGINPGSEVEVVVSHPLIAGLLPNVPRRGVRKRAPIGVRWLTRHVELVPQERFVDVLVSGPFARWRHEHEFADGPGGSTIVTDRVTWELHLPFPGRLDQAIVEMQLDGLFAFRERQLRDDLDLHTRLASSPRRVVVAGGSGLIGTQVCAALTSGGHDVVRLVRGPVYQPDAVSWDPAAHRLNPAALEGADAVINLSGHSIGGRFTRRHKGAVLRSRLDATATLAGAIASAGVPTLVQASAIGYYGPRRPHELLTEQSAPGEGFLAATVQAWEAASKPAKDAGARVTLLRTGIVLSEGGGALAPQVPLFSIGMGGRLAAPDAWCSWVGLDDVVRAYVHTILTDVVEGPTNLVAPRPVTQQEFATTLGRILHRPAMLPTPALGPTLMLGAEGYNEMIDTDQRVSVVKLGESGFWFAQGTLADALRHALMR